MFHLGFTIYNLKIKKTFAIGLYGMSHSLTHWSLMQTDEWVNLPEEFPKGQFYWCFTSYAMKSFMTP